MAVMFTTYDPQGLLEAFRAAVSQREPKGKIVTWECHPDGRHYTHSAIQWRFKAFMMPAARDGSLVFNIIRNKNFEVSTSCLWLLPRPLGRNLPQPLR